MGSYVLEVVRFRGYVFSRLYVFEVVRFLRLYGFRGCMFSRLWGFEVVGLWGCGVVCS